MVQYYWKSRCIQLYRRGKRSEKGVDLPCAHKRFSLSTRCIVTADGDGYWWSGHDVSWEADAPVLADNLASPLRIQIDASNGASDYGNKFGEPLITGFTRSFGLRLATFRVAVLGGARPPRVLQLRAPRLSLVDW